MKKNTVKKSASNATYHPGDRFVLRGDPNSGCLPECEGCCTCRDTEVEVVSVLSNGMVYVTDGTGYSVEELEEWRKGEVIRARRTPDRHAKKSALKKSATRFKREATAAEVLACFENTNRISLMGLRRMLGFSATGEVPLTGKATRELMRLGKIRHDNAYSTESKGVLVAYELVH